MRIAASALRLALLLALSAGASGCVHKGFFTDGTSVSYGRSTRGILLRGKELPRVGRGYAVPPLWVGRDTRFGVDELVDAVVRAAARVDDQLPGGTLGVGDLSARRGGRATHHRSHANGRDADLIFYALDAETGQPVGPAPDAMPRYGRHLQSRPPRETPQTPISPRRFDLPRNWALVAALLEDPSIDVEYLFLSEPLRDKLLEHAARVGEPDEVIARARAALRAPRGGILPHDDHLHLRLRCSAADRALGCVDAGRIRLHVEHVPGPANS